MCYESVFHQHLTHSLGLNCFIIIDRHLLLLYKHVRFSMYFHVPRATVCMCFIENLAAQYAFIVKDFILKTLTGYCVI